MPITMKSLTTHFVMLVQNKTMPKEIANKTKENTYYKCTHCGDEIFWNTHKKLTYCKCKKIWIDSCEDYIRIGGKEEDYSVIKK